MDCRSLFKLLLLSTAVIPVTSIEAGSSHEPALVINEIMPANIDMFLDPSFNYGSWIELYNPGAVDIDIRGWYLSNDSTYRLQCPLGDASRIVRSHGFLTLWFGHQDDYCPLQVDFDLKYEGGTVLLSDKDGHTVSKVDYATVPARISFARTIDGADEWGMTGTPTPGKTNSTSQFAAQQLEAPVVNVDSKLFTDQFYFNVTIPDGATLYYTKNGSTPTPDNPAVKTSSGSHTVSDTKIYRFRLYKDGMLPSPVTTRSYICTSNAYGIPVVSVVTDSLNLYSTEFGLWEKGPNGLSGNGQTDLCNWNRDWDRPVNIEIIDTKGNVLINQEAEITPSGRYSRAYDPHPFKVEAKKRYGYDNYFTFTPFSNKPYNKYQSLKFRSGGNSFSTRLKDAALQQVIISSGFNVDCQSYQPVHHYINGVYKGVINIREPNNKDFGYSNYGYDEDEMDCFKLDHNNGGGGFTLTLGSRDPWDEWVNLSKTAYNDASYSRICQIVDVDEFINYMAVEFFLANQDWPRNNIKAFRHSPDGHYRFVVFDLDHAFGSVNQATDINPFSFFDSEEYYSDGTHNYKSAMVTVFHNMMKNDTFRKQFIDSFCILAGSVFHPDRTRSIVNSLASRVQKEMAFNNESPWADANLIIGTITTDYSLNRLNQLGAWSYSKLGSTPKASKIITSDIPQAVITLNGQVIPNRQLTGYVFLPARVKAIAPDGYRFVGWKNTRDQILSVSNEFDLSDSYECIIASFEPDGIDKRPIRINEISAGNDVFVNETFSKHDWIELYNTTSQPYDISGMFLSDNISDRFKYSIPEGTEIPAKGYLVVWCDNESGRQLHAPFKLENKDDKTVILTAKDLSWADTLVYKSHAGYQSVGLFPDGGGTSYIMNRPSIGKTNNLSSYDPVDKKDFTKIRTISADRKSSLIVNPAGQPVLFPSPGELYIKDGKKFFYRP